jgi:hypothetical protein
MALGCCIELGATVGSPVEFLTIGISQPADLHSTLSEKTHDSALSEKTHEVLHLTPSFALF